MYSSKVNSHWYYRWPKIIGEMEKATFKSYICQLDSQWSYLGIEKSHLISHLLQTGLWRCLWVIFFLISKLCAMSQYSMGGAILWQIALKCLRKQAIRNKSVSSVLWSPLWFLPPSSCFDFVCWLPMIIDYNL